MSKVGYPEDWAKSQENLQGREVENFMKVLNNKAFVAFRSKGFYDKT